jgi:hypothetical protein
MTVHSSAKYSTPKPLAVMFVRLVLVELLLLIGLLAVVVQAYPDGAPNCALGRAAPETLHLAAENYKTGLLSDYDLDLVMSNRIVPHAKSGATNHNFAVGISHEVSLRFRNSTSTTPSESSWRGVLLILHHVNQLDVSAGLTPILPYKAAAGCGGSWTKVGVTHADRRRKDVLQPIALLRVDTLSTGWLLEVNVVFANNGEYSTYFYSQFALSSVSPNNNTARPITLRPTAKPTAKPTSKPATAAPMSAVASPMAPLPAAPMSSPPPLPNQSFPTTPAPVYSSPMVATAPALAPSRRKCPWWKRLLRWCH